MTTSIRRRTGALRFQTYTDSQKYVGVSAMSHDLSTAPWSCAVFKYPILDFVLWGDLWDDLRGDLL